MDREVTKTLAELERKLAQLERELTSIGRPAQAAEHEPRDAARAHDAHPAYASAGPPPPPHVPAPGAMRADDRAPHLGRIVDEAVEGPGGAIERDWSVPVRETAFGEIPPHAGEVHRRDEQGATGANAVAAVTGQAGQPPAMVPVASLEAFRDKLARTIDALIEEYDELLSLRPRRD